jgi:thymidine phosphorylase
MVTALGGPADYLERIEAYLPAAAVVRPARAARAGFVTAMDTRAIGVAVLQLGGGRSRAEQSIDYAVGLSEVCQRGDAVGSEQPLALIHARNDAAAARAEAVLQQAIVIGDEPPAPAAIVRERIGS